MYSFEEIMEFHPDNRYVYNEIKRNLSALIPFVGAGLTQFAYYSWSKALTKMAEKITNDDSHKKVEELIGKKGAFLLEAAQCLEELRGPSNLARDIANLFSPQKMEEKQNQLPTEGIWLLPLLFSGLIITTNFDQVLETVYAKHSMPFQVFEPDHPEMLNQYLNQAGDFPGIFKLHGSVCGDYIEYNRIIFTEKQYDYFYCEGSLLVEALKKCFSYKSVLFLGCSLSHDRTMQLLEQVIQPGQYHYTIINCEESEQDNKIKELENKHIRAIVYEGNRHEAVRTILEQLLKESHPEKYQKAIQNSISNKKFLLSANDPVKILINEANEKSVTGNYLEALHIAQEALKVAEKINKNDEKYFLRVAYAKLQCAMKMHQIPEYHNEAINFISDILKTGVFDEFSDEMFLLYYHLADISISATDLSTARAAIEKAEPLSRDDYDTIHCESVKGKIAIGEGRHDDAIHLLKKMVDTINFKLVTKDYKDAEECCMLEQNLAVTFNDIAIAYRSKGNLQYAMIYVKRAVDAAESESLEYERAIFLDYWADMLIEDSLFDSAIEKATTAQEIFKKRNEKSRFVHACDLLGVAYFRQGNLTLSCTSYLDAFDAAEKVESKLYFSQKIAQLSAKLGNEKMLNEQIEFIREFQKFDDYYSLSMFEKWAKDLQIACSNVLPNDFKDQPETYFLFDEEDSDIVKWREKLIEIGETSHDITERDERVLAYLMHYSEEISKKKKDNVNSESELKKLRSKFGDSKSLSEKAQLMYEIGGWYYRQHNGEEADRWILKAMNAEGASKHTVIWSKITHAQVLMNRRTIEDDNEAKAILDEVSSIVEASKKYEAIAFCEFNRGRLEARKGNFKYALSLLKKAYRALDDGQIENEELRKDIKEKYFDINQYLHFEDNPTEDLSSLQTELLFLQTWYPKYSQQLSEYWWHYRANEPLNNMRVFSSSACVIFSDDINKIYWHSEALRFLFAHCMYAPKESWQNMQHIVKRTIPVPCNTPFPYSRMMVKNKKVDGKLYGYNQQVDGSERVYAYKQLQDEVSFDKNRIPEPITLSFLGYRFPDMVSKIVPMVDEFGSCRWWIGAEFDGSPNALMNLVSKFGIVPVFDINDINQAKDIIILRSERIDIPFIIDNRNDKDRVYLQKRLRYITSISDQLTVFEEFDKIVEFVCGLERGEFPLISIHLAIVRFGYHVWSESPIQWRVYPIIMINSEDEWRNSENDSAVSKSIAIRDADCLMQRISAYVHHSHDIDEYYIKQDALELLELGKYINDEAIKKTAKGILTALDELNSN